MEIKDLKIFYLQKNFLKNLDSYLYA